MLPPPSRGAYSTSPPWRRECLSQWKAPVLRLLSVQQGSHPPYFTEYFLRMAGIHPYPPVENIDDSHAVLSALHSTVISLRSPEYFSPLDRRFMSTCLSASLSPVTGKRFCPLKDREKPFPAK